MTDPRMTAQALSVLLRVKIGIGQMEKEKPVYSLEKRLSAKESGAFADKVSDLQICKTRVKHTGHTDICTYKITSDLSYK